MRVSVLSWRKSAIAVVLILGVPLLAGCIRGKHTTGVSNLWRVPGLTFTNGQTSDQEVLDALGPPSQLIALEKYTVFYYLLEKSDKTGLITIVYNMNTQEVEAALENSFRRAHNQ